MFRCRFLIQHTNVPLFEALFVPVLLIICVQRRQAVYVKRNIENLSRNHCCRRKNYTRYIFWVWVCSLSYPASQAHAPHNIVICGLSCSTSSHKTARFSGKKFIKHKVCGLTFSTTFIVIFVILWRIQRDIIIFVHVSSCKVPVILVRF